MSLVSVIIPTYNSAKYIKRCLDSVVKQSWINKEIIIVDNGSQDETLNILKEYELKYENIILLNEIRRGPSFARNLGIERANGEYIVFVDSDDYLELDYIKILISEMINSNVDIVTCGYYDISKYGIYIQNDFFMQGVQPNNVSFIKNIFKGVGGTLWGKAFKLNIINNYSIRMDESIFMCEDLLFVLNYALKCQSFACVDQSLYFYNRLNESSISTNINLEYCECLHRVNRLIEELLNQSELISRDITEIVSNRDLQLDILRFKLIVKSKQKYKLKQLDSILKNKDFMDNLNINRKKFNFIFFILLKKKRIILLYLYFIIEEWIQLFKDFIRFIVLNK